MMMHGMVSSLMHWSEVLKIVQYMWRSKEQKNLGFFFLAPWDLEAVWDTCQIQWKSKSSMLLNYWLCWGPDHVWESKSLRVFLKPGLMGYQRHWLKSQWRITRCAWITMWLLWCGYVVANWYCFQCLGTCCSWGKWWCSSWLPEVLDKQKG